jgi:hypothetical protein
MADMGKASMEAEKRRIERMEREAANEKTGETVTGDISRTE